MDIDIGVSAGQTILIINCGPSGSENKDVSNCSSKLSSCVGSSGVVRVAELSELDAISSSSYDAVCIVDPVHVTKLDLPTVLRLLRPDGVFWMMRTTVQSDAALKPAVDSVISALTLAGFINSHAEVGSGDTGNTALYRVRASKPSYEVGTSLPIKLPSKNAAATAWTLAAQDVVDDIDVIDSDTVLDADDLKKPDPALLRTCGVSDGTAKRKACKNCTCGLAEQMDGEDEMTSQQAKTSSCGNCYLGDAFRCAACPYRGMPAFKPGEKVQLPALSMHDDV